MEIYNNLDLTNIENEVWLNAFGLEDWYMVSNFGRVKRIERTFIRKNKEKTFNECVFLPEMILKQGINYKGYCRLTLTYKNKRFSITSHRIVAKTFIPNDNPEKNQVNHINGIKTDNRVDNLEWCDNSYNQKHRYTHLGAKPNNIIKFNESKKRKVVKLNKDYSLYKTYDSIVDAIKDTPKSISQNIIKVCLGKREFCAGYRWMYYENYIEYAKPI